MIHLITQNEYIDYKRASTNISNYYQYGFRALVLSDGNLIYNSSYGIIQLIKELVIKIFNPSYQRDAISAKQNTLQSDFDSVNQIFNKLRMLHRLDLNPDECDPYDLFYSILVAQDFKLNQERFINTWKKSKSFNNYVGEAIDYCMGYRPKSINTQVRGPYTSYQMTSPNPQKLDELAQINFNNMPGLLSFVLNDCVHSSPFAVGYYLRALRKDHPGPKATIHYCQAVFEFMNREDKRDIFADRKQDLLLEFIRHSLLAIESSWDRHSVRWLQKTLKFFSELSEDKRQNAYDLYKAFLSKARREHPDASQDLGAFEQRFIE